MQYRNVVFPDSLTFHCQGCGGCCKNQPPDISPSEQQRIDKAGYTNYMENPNDPTNRNLKRTSDGSCIFFTKDKTCQINHIKPSICKLEPFIITDFDYRKNLIYLNINPLATKECQGLNCGSMVAYADIAKAAQTIVEDLYELVAKSTGLLVTDKRIGALVRNYLIS